ncbi:MAG: GGDEF domain-containing protein [Porphyrobacter sp.]|nr:GGDEF domain-containing protein [Porphyrobacter sp.]
MQVSPTIRLQLEAGLFGSVPIFLGGIFNSIAVAAIAVWRQPTTPFFVWLAVEIALGIVRLPVLLAGRRALRNGKTPPKTTAAILSSAWAASIGFGAYFSLTHHDWVLSTIVCLSAAAMVSGICLRNFGTPRLAALMVFLALAPSTVAGTIVSQPGLAIISIQLPIFILTIFSASFVLHRMMVTQMTALSDLEKSEFFNRIILESSPDYTIIINEQHDIIFFNRPNSALSEQGDLIGSAWLSLLHPADREGGEKALADVACKGSANLTTRRLDADGRLRWFDVIASRISDDSGRILMVARDITHQKRSEERALWMARHDPLTGLPNRAVLQDELDRILGTDDPAAALLMLDIDNFKTINDTLGHDAGDRMLSTFAERLQAALGEEDLVVRLGGDEFAILFSARSDADVWSAGARIYAGLCEPFEYQGKLLACGASIGASRLWHDGANRSEIMKAADIALYAAKTAGRGQLKLFESSMRAEVEGRETMVAAALTALKQDRVVPFFQPKMSLGTSRIVGFEALLRCTSADNQVLTADDIKAAFDDPALCAVLSERMIERTLSQIERWLAADVPFGHVAINLTAADFRREGFVDSLLTRLQRKAIPPSCLQIEVTETVFLGRGAGYVEAALRSLSESGIKIALDDFGTGYASLSHLSQFPIDLLKIDRTFVQRLGQSPEAKAICAAVVNLGHCLGMQIVAEGVETLVQENALIDLGCDVCQGFLYSKAMPAEAIPMVLLGQDAKPLRARRA